MEGDSKEFAKKLEQKMKEERDRKERQTPEKKKSRGDNGSDAGGLTPREKRQAR